MDGEWTNEEDRTRRQQIILQTFLQMKILEKFLQMKILEKCLQMKILEKCLMTDLLTFELSPGHEETLIGTNLTTE